MLHKQQELLKKQQQQIDTLSQTSEKNQQPRKGNRPMRGFGRGRGLVCYAC